MKVTAETPEDSLLRLTQELEVAREKRDDRYAEWSRAVYLANRSGVSYPRIAEMTNRSVARIEQVIREERRRRGEIA